MQLTGSKNNQLRFNESKEDVYNSITLSHLRQVLNVSVSKTFSVNEDELRAPTRCRAKAAFARQVAMYLAHTRFGLTLTAVGHLFERDRTTVAHGCSLIEDSRDSPCLDQTLAVLEQALPLYRTLTRHQ